MSSRNFLVTLMMLTLLQSLPGAQPQDKTEALAEKCGSELTWAKDWNSAAKRAREEDRVVLVFVQMYTDFRGLAAGPLMDRYTVKLIEEHCVPVRYQRGMDAPITSYEHYGIGPYSFGSTVLIAKPDGTVIADLLVSRTIPFRDFLLQHLPPLTAVADCKQNNDRDVVEHAERLVERGHLEKTLAILKAPKTADEFLLKARTLRLLRRGESAIAAITSARQVNGDSVEPLASLSEAITLLRMGQADRAVKVIEAALPLADNHDCKPEFLFWQGACLATTAGTDSAAKVWGDLANRFPESRWAWKAAGLMSRKPFRDGVSPDFAWPTNGTIEFLRIPRTDPLGPDSIAKAERDVIDYLITHQREDGSWRSTPNELKATLYRTDSLMVAVTAISARALMPHMEDKRVLKAVKAALKFTTEWAKRESTREPQEFIYDYSAWGYAYALRLFASCSKTDLATRQELTVPVQAMLTALKRMQMQGGGWNYRIAGIVDGKPKSTNQSASFMTATVVLALLEAKNAGFEVPDEMLNSAVACVRRSRSSNGSFEYFLTHDNEAQRAAKEQGSAGRGPVCSLALFKAGKADLAALRMSLDVFMKHKQSYAREAGKSLMHAAPDGQGSHYLLYDYAWAAEAMNELPVVERAIYKTQLRRLVLQTRLLHGSFVDNPINGTHYGAGMALEALIRCNE